MNPEDKESQELARRLRIALQKSGELIPSDLDVDEELPVEAIEADLPSSLSDIDAAMKRILEDEDDYKVVEFPSHSPSIPFATAARNGELKLSQETKEKLKRKED